MLEDLESKIAMSQQSLARQVRKEVVPMNLMLMHHFFLLYRYEIYCSPILIFGNYIQSVFTPEGTFRIRFDLRHKLYWYYKEQRITNPDFRSPALGIVTGARTNPDVKQSGEEDLQRAA